MDILGIGVPELAFIILISIVVLGPKDMQKAGKTIGTWMRKIIMSPEWREIKNASNKLKSIPHELMREAHPDLEQYRRDQKINVTMPKEKEGYGAWDDTFLPKKSEATNSIAPPTDVEPAPAKTTDASPETSPINDSAPLDTDNA